MRERLLELSSFNKVPYWYSVQGSDTRMLLYVLSLAQKKKGRSFNQPSTFFTFYTLYTLFTSHLYTNSPYISSRSAFTLSSSRYSSKVIRRSIMPLGVSSIIRLATVSIKVWSWLVSSTTPL